MARTYQLIREQWVPHPLEEAFAFFSRPENLQEITPGWLDFRIARVEKELHTGSLIEYRLRWHGIPMRWTSEITDWSRLTASSTTRSAALIPDGITNIASRLRTAERAFEMRFSTRCRSGSPGCLRIG